MTGGAAEPESRELYKPERLLAFSDGVFAVAITLLVIDLRLPPTAEGGDDAAVLAALLDMRPKLLIFVMTFLVIGLSWMGHHRKFHYIRWVDRGLLWLNLAFLLALCLVPFASSLLSGNHNRVSFIVYAGTMAVVCLLSSAMTGYALSRPYLAVPDIRPGRRFDMIVSPLAAAAIFLASAGLALIHKPAFAYWCLLLIFPASAFAGTRKRA